jgi:hypothetical protein
VLVFFTVVSAAIGLSVTSATAAEPTPATPQKGSAAGHSTSPTGLSPAPTASLHAPGSGDQPKRVPRPVTQQEIADKAKVEAGFRSPNQKPSVTLPGAPSRAGLTDTQTLATTFPGVTQTSLTPPDTIVAAGPSNVVIAVNAEIGVYTKTGTQLSVQELKDVFASQGQPAQDFVFDPWVVYDPYVQRFWLMALSSHDNPNRSTMLVAVSNSSDATEGWNTFSMDARVNGSDSTDNWCDRDTLGFDTQAIYITCNEYAFPTSGSDLKTDKIRVMTKGQFLSGACCSWWDFYNQSEGPFGFSTPADIRPTRMIGATDSDGEYLVDAHRGGGLDDNATLEVWHITNPGNCCGTNQTAPDLSQNGRPVGSYDQAPDVRQHGTSATINPGNTRLEYAIWQGGHLTTGQDLACPDVHAACVSYTEIDVSKFPDMSLVNDFALQSDATVDRFYPNADANAAGDKTMVFSASGPNRFAGTSFVLVPNSSTCTKCANSETSIADGLGPYGTSGKQDWGDYSGASADPDGDGVWVAGEFASTNSEWATQIGLTRDRIPTAITYTGPLGANANATVQLSANVVQAASGSPAPLAGVIVTFFLGTQVCNATTDANGRAACAIQLDQPEGTVDLEAETPGDPDHMPSSTTRRFTIGTGGRNAATLTYTGARTGEFQATADLSATLIDASNGNGISGDTITFTLGSQSCTGDTDAAGLAHCSILLQQRPGAYTVTADFPGDFLYGAATDSAPFTISKGQTITTLTSSRNPSDFGQAVTFTATVAAVNSGAVSPGGQVAYRRSTIPLGTQILDAVGHSSLTVPILQVGQNDITATYGGDDFFLGSNESLTQTVQCTTTLTGVQSGGLNLTAGSTCLTNATVNGSVTIGPGAAVSITNSLLNGRITTATDVLALTICGSTTHGDLRLTGSQKFVLIGDAGDDGQPACAGNQMHGNVTIFGGRGQAEIGGNTITEDLIVNNSSGTPPDEESAASEIEANTIGGDLFCDGNTPSPADDGHPNKITGQGFGQCIGF